MKTFLTIAASDSIGGAGIQADIRTATLLGLYPVCALTAVTAQNSEGVAASADVGCDMLRRQLECVLSDLRPDAVKIGLLPSAEAVETVAGILRDSKLPAIVLDPVLSPTLGAAFCGDDVADAIVTLLMPLVTLATPNRPEYDILCERAGMPVENFCDILLKGGHPDPSDATLPDECVDRLIPHLSSGSDTANARRREVRTFRSKRLHTDNTHGTGCVLSSAIASYIALGLPVEEAVAHAKEFLFNALSRSRHLRFGKGYGPALSIPENLHPDL